ncbi:MAG: hypothetical protein ACRD2X_21310 [Vicinamibacteraceae bacterium]
MAARLLATLLLATLPLTNGQIATSSAAAPARDVAPPPSPSLPWYMRETAMTEAGRLTFLTKPWWPKAQALAEGERFTLDLDGNGRPETIVTRENGHIVQAIDDSGRAAEIWNTANTAYLVSFKGTGLVDRLIDYIDNDDDGRADEMELRHYRDGHLRYAWFGENYDDDGTQIFELKDWSYAGGDGINKFRGNLQIFLNKYDPVTKEWLPLSECPFAFWDDDGDGHGDTVLRVSAAPLASLTGPDTDYANNYDYMWARQATPLRELGNVNVRFSFNLDVEPRPEGVDAPHYTFGFTMVGRAPYDYPDMTYTNPRRRPPQMVRRIAWKRGIDVGMRYPAQETGFTWDESRSVRRWEGQFWIYERVYLSNTGGPTTRWNMRREYSPTPSSTREIYYSAADKRYHLVGATEGWLEVGHLAEPRKDLEFRWLDTDRDGYLDTVQVFLPGRPAPVRVARFTPRARRVPLDREALTREYHERVLPQAIEENRQVIAALKNVARSPAAAAYEAEAGHASHPERVRYCLDIARELHYLAVRDALYARAAAGPYPSREPDSQKKRSMAPGSPEAGYSMGDSLRFWTMTRRIEAFVQHYDEGRYPEAARALEALASHKEK